jgi:predicted nucleic acid binding AN1-type Zn finger protein
MTNFMQNVNPHLVADSRSTTGSDMENVALEPTDAKANQTGQVILNQQTDTTKCWTCTKKVGLLGFKCKCKYTFCSQHRDASHHSCTFDYKAANRARLEKDLKPCVAEKLTRI